MLICASSSSSCLKRLASPAILLLKRASRACTSFWCALASLLTSRRIASYCFLTWGRRDDGWAQPEDRSEKGMEGVRRAWKVGDGGR